MGRLARTLIIVAIVAGGLLVGGAIAPTFGVRPQEHAVATTGSSAFMRPRAAGSLERSIDALQQRVAIVPRDAGAWATLGLAYLQQARITGEPGYYPRARGALERSLAEEPSNADGLLGMAVLAAAEHDFAGALRIGTRVRRLQPFDPAVRGIVGDALVELGRYDAGFSSFQAMVDIRPDTGSLARVSYARELRGDLRGAIRAMRGARIFAGTPADAAWTGAHLGLLYLNEGRVPAAARAFRVAAQLDAGSTQPVLGRSLVAFARGDLRGARRLAAEVVSMNPSPEHAVLAGDLAALAGEPGEAARMYELARAGFELLEASGVDVNLELALFEADRGDPRRALAAARAVWAERRSVQAADAMAWTLHVNGRDDRAARFARRARSLGTREGLYLFHAGMIELARGRASAGRSLLTRALAVDPWFSVLGPSEARRALAGSDPA